jgi:hypothetical protein
MGMRRYLLVLDLNRQAAAGEFDAGPVAYLTARQREEAAEVVVLSVAGAPPKLSPMEMLLGAGIGKMPVAPAPDHDLSAEAEHRMNLAVQHLTEAGCQASGIISDEDLTAAVKRETGHHHYDELLLAAEAPAGSWLSHLLGRDPLQRLRSRWGNRLIECPPPVLDSPHPTPSK